MARTIQVGNAPARPPGELEAPDEGLPLTSSGQAILERKVPRPQAAEVFARIAGRTPVVIRPAAAELLREERDRR